MSDKNQERIADLEEFEREQDALRAGGEEAEQFLPEELRAEFRKLREFKQSPSDSS